MNRSGFWNDSLKIGAPSRRTTRFPCLSVLLMLIVMGLIGPAAPTGGFACGFEAGAVGVAGKPAIAVGHGPEVGLGVVIHSRIDRAGVVAPTGAAAGVMREVPARVLPVGAGAGLAVGVVLAAGAGVGVG